jgi:hypothetical protein
MYITNAELAKLREALEDLSEPHVEFDVRTGYSGRGMYDSECIGFVTSKPIALHGAICAILAEANYEWGVDSDFAEIDWFLLNPCTDSMGLSSILYYSNLQLVDD